MPARRDLISLSAPPSTHHSSARTTVSFPLLQFLIHSPLPLFELLFFIASLVWVVSPPPRVPITFQEKTQSGISAETADSADFSRDAVEVLRRREVREGYIRDSVLMLMV
ncbi:hypothetical protein GE061_013622 [Apolygus lucorum]|uniref:Uncharacterized protein n=1 Tax=Apolygus lucorum TaxID=248454 RepID=A0A6A4JYM3_APOLU|nr:hypothetical protein GE061_013622 [Apolygus lucorum]